MNILYEEQCNKTEVYSYKINRGGLRRIDSHEEITITFINNEFFKAEYNFGPIYSRSSWRVLRAIEEKITELEERYQEALNIKLPPIMS